MKKKRAPMAIVETSSPMERLATDILGELPETENGNRYILVVTDYYTKWTESFPMPNMEASTVVKIIVEEVISRFRIVQEHQRDWDKYIPFVMMAYRASEHDTTGQTPNRLMFDKSGDLTYKVDCGIRGTPQIIHMDRIKLKHKQVLRGEMYEGIDNPQVTEPRELDVLDNNMDTVIDQDDRIGKKKKVVAVKNETSLDCRIRSGVNFSLCIDIVELCFEIVNKSCGTHVD
ncbi:unnamed protein product [Mytilus edulis]|uniref:Integrase catalytic domain-containing protein n=1 Tax=Mytilus edulis TaxID=6550 RepID=A0A8S3SV97_MYTED|nr:unnamed protein product [Mytilus edulis]